VADAVVCSWLVVPVTSASDLSGLSWMLFFKYHCEVCNTFRQSSSCVVSTHGEVKLGVIGKATEAILGFGLSSGVILSSCLGVVNATHVVAGVSVREKNSNYKRL